MITMTAKELRKIKKSCFLLQWSDGSKDFSIESIVERLFSQELFAYEHIGSVKNDGTMIVCPYENESLEFNIIIELIRKMLRDRDHSYVYKMKTIKDKFKVSRDSLMMFNSNILEDEFKIVIEKWITESKIVINYVDDNKTYQVPDYYDVGTEIYRAILENGIYKGIESVKINKVDVGEFGDGSFILFYETINQDKQVDKLGVVDKLSDTIGQKSLVKNNYWYAETKEELKTKMTDLYLKEIENINND